jgi:hypothetical protein
MGNTKWQSGSRQIGGRPDRLSPADLRKENPAPTEHSLGRVQKGLSGALGHRRRGLPGPVAGMHLGRLNGLGGWVGWWALGSIAWWYRLSGWYRLVGWLLWVDCDAGYGALASAQDQETAM